MIFNGISVRWRGWIDRMTLIGQGCFEFDGAGAEVRVDILLLFPEEVIKFVIKIESQRMDGNHLERSTAINTTISVRKQDD